MAFKVLKNKNLLGILETISPLLKHFAGNAVLRSVIQDGVGVESQCDNKCLN